MVHQEQTRRSCTAWTAGHDSMQLSETGNDISFSNGGLRHRIYVHTCRQVGHLSTPGVYGDAVDRSHDCTTLRSNIRRGPSENHQSRRHDVPSAHPTARPVQERMPSGRLMILLTHVPWSLHVIIHDLWMFALKTTIIREPALTNKAWAL